MLYGPAMSQSDYRKAGPYQLPLITVFMGHPVVLRRVLLYFFFYLQKYFSTNYSMFYSMATRVLLDLPRHCNFLKQAFSYLRECMATPSIIVTPYQCNFMK